MRKDDTACIKISYRGVAVIRATGQGQAEMSVLVLKLQKGKS